MGSARSGKDRVSYYEREVFAINDMTLEIPCFPNCGSEVVSRNGQTRHRKQNYKCRECRGQFVLNPAWKAITKEQQELMSRMLLERISQAGIARVLQVSEDTVRALRKRSSYCC
jgi:transposase-like protein